MTADWFDDLAERCGDAADYAEDDDPSIAREFRLAQHNAADLALAIRKLLMLASPDEVQAVRAGGRNEVA